MKFVDVKNDVAFHKIFGNANKTAMLISFLNAVLRLEEGSRVAAVQIENPYMFPASHGGKTVIIDIRATDQQGRKFIVEMQVADKEGFVKRTQFYAARDYASQIDSGEKYKALRPTHFIGILDFIATDNPAYYSHHVTMDTVTGQQLLTDVQYFFIELPKFEKSLAGLTTMIDRWTYFIKNAENLTVIPADVADEGLKAAYEEADKHNWDKAELNAYYDAGAREADQINERLRAEEIGREKMETEMIFAMHRAGISIEQIALVTGKPVTEIERMLP